MHLAAMPAVAGETPTTGTNANIVSRAEIDRMPLIESHSHGSLTGKDLPTITDLIALQRRERLNYVVMIIEDKPEQVAAVRENKDFMCAMLWVNPLKEGWLENAERFTRENRDILRGYKLHPSIHHFDVKPELLDGLFALANREHLFIVTHTDNGPSKAGQYRPLLEKYPATKLILYHASPAQEAFALVKAFPNVYVDVSYLAWGKPFQQEALRAVGKEKILYGIDSPLGFQNKDGVLLPHYRDAAAEVAAFYDNDRDVVERVFYRNAARLFELPESKLGK